MPTPHHPKATLLLLVAAALFTLPARAIIVQGKVTNPYGIPIGNARVQLIQGRGVAAFTLTHQDGTYEIRSAAPGRFLLITSAAPYTPNIGEDFYGSRTSVVTRNVTLQYTTVSSQLSTTFSGVPTPVQQIPAMVTLIPQLALATQIGIVNDLRQSSGTNVVQTGQAGGPIALYLRGGSPKANKILIDGVPATNLGGYFDFSPISTTTLNGPEIYRGANSALYGTGAEAGVVDFSTSHTKALRPTVNYTGDAGNFYTYRNEAILSGAINKLDYLAAFSRFNTSNALPLDEYHLTTETANLGYSIVTNTTLRFTLRNTDSVTGLPGAHDIYGISSSGKQSNQNINSGLTVENVLGGKWHNLARYGISRNREQVEQFAPTGEPVTRATGDTFAFTYYGNPVTLRGANGYTASGQAAFILPAYDAVSNRDELDYQSDYTFPWRIALLFTFHYENERGRILDSATPDGRIVKRTNYLYNLQLQGDIKHRLFYSAGGSVEQNELYGIAGTPRLGLTYDAVRPGHRPFHGTLLRANTATGVQEPSLDAQLSSLFTLLQQTSPQEQTNPVISTGAERSREIRFSTQTLDSSRIANDPYNVAPITAERSRTYDVGVEQNILNQKLILKAGYFHNQFNHQIESIGANGLETYFNIPVSVVAQLPPATLNSLAYRTQGLEMELQYQALNHLFLRGGYTYLASLVEQSFSSDAVTPAINPNLPGIPIGALSPLVDNLLSQQHIGPIGYPGLPFTIRAGLKIKIGGD
jgi:vitamin B12 transporter